MSSSDWVLYVVLPLLLLVAGLVLFLAGRKAHEEATRIVAGFGGPAGSTDVPDGQLAVEDNRAAVLAAQRKMLWGGLLMGVGAIWLIAGLVTRAL